MNNYSKNNYKNFEPILKCKKIIVRWCSLKNEFTFSILVSIIGVEISLSNYSINNNKKLEPIL